eukprot:tig00020934_g16118.t1
MARKSKRDSEADTKDEPDKKPESKKAKETKAAAPVPFKEINVLVWWREKPELLKPVEVKSEKSLPDFKDAVFSKLEPAPLRGVNVPPVFPWKTQVRESVWVEGAKEHEGCWWNTPEDKLPAGLKRKLKQFENASKKEESKKDTPVRETRRRAS